MTTGNFEKFAGTITDIGPLYPFVGSEMVLVIIALVFWLGWHFSELRIEKREYETEVEKLSDPGAVEQHLKDRAE